MIIIKIYNNSIIYCLYCAKKLQFSAVTLFASYFCFKGGCGDVFMSELVVTRCVEDIHQVISVV